MDVVGLCGYAQSGKDTAGAYLSDLGYTRLAFADAVRESLYRLNPIIESNGPSQGDARHSYRRVVDIVDRVGWDDAKTTYPEIRMLLQRMGTEVGRDLHGENFWVDIVRGKMESGGRYVITDVRFTNELLMVKSLGGRVFRIVRPGVGPVNSHSSDTVTGSLDVDGEFLNDRDVEWLRSQITQAVTHH